MKAGVVPFPTRSTSPAQTRNRPRALPAEMPLPGDVWEELVTQALSTDVSENLIERIAESVAARLDRPQSVVNPLALLPFERAAAQYLEKRAQRVAPNTLRIDRERLVILEREFAGVPLEDITDERVAQFQRDRIAQGISGRTVNMETSLLKRILEPAGLWSAIEPEVIRFAEASNVGRAITPAEKRRLFQVGWSRPGWRLTICAALLSAATTARGCELRGLRWGDVDLPAGILHFRKSKTAAGVRTVPLNPDAIQVLRWLHRRAAALGYNQLDHYILHGFVKRRPDPTRPRSKFSGANGWRAITKAAGLPGLRMHDLRHLSITELLESGAPEHVVMSLAGHVSKQMLERYSHPRLQAKQEAVDKLAHGFLPLPGPRKKGLTKRQKQVAELIRYGLDQPAIAQQLGIAESGIKSHCWRLAQRVNVTTWDELRERFQGPEA